MRLVDAAAPVNRIIPFSTVDGPGCRTAVFMQGCNFACAYCHNPETMRLCNNCGLCVDVCPEKALRLEAGTLVWNEGRCSRCDACILRCPHASSPRVTIMTPEAVFARVRENMPFIRGISVSGGECTLYPAFLTALFSLAKGAGLSCLIDSNGNVDLESFPYLMRLCDGVMLDLKSWDKDIHRALTAADNSIVKKNLLFLARAGKLAELRIVCLEGDVDMDAIIDGAAQLLRGALSPCVAAQTGAASGIDVPLALLRFRKYGVRGRLADRPSPSDAMMCALELRARRAGFRTVTVV